MMERIMRTDQKDKLNALQVLVASHRSDRARGATSSSHFPAAVRAAAVTLISEGLNLRTVSRKAQLCPRVLTAWCRQSSEQAASKSLTEAAPASPRVLEVIGSSPPKNEVTLKQRFRFGLGLVVGKSFWQFGFFCGRTSL